MAILTEQTEPRQAVTDADIEALERRAAAGEDVYADATSMGSSAREDKDMSRWRLGDIALTVEKRYGENSIAQFAKDINESVTSVEEYRTTCRFWTRSVRAEFLEIPVLTYSHLRSAKRLYDKFGMDGVRDFLYKAADNTWTTEQTRIEVNLALEKPVPPERLLDAAAWVTSADVDSGRLVFDLARGVDSSKIAKLFAGRKVRLVVTESKE